MATSKSNNVYINLGGDIKGDISAANYDGWIQVQSYNFGVARPITSTPGESTRRGGEGVDVSSVIFTKEVDATSPILMQNACTGAGISEAKMHYTQQGTNGKEPVQEITLKDCIISSYEQIIIEGKPVDKVGLSYTEIQFSNTPYDENNKAGTPVKGGFNIKTSQKI